MINSFMKAILSKLSYRLILLQIGFLYLFSHAAERFYYTLNSGIFECVYRHGPKMGRQCMEQYPEYDLVDLLVGPIHSMLYGLVIGAVIIGIVNWRKKYHFLNLFTVLGLYILLFFGGIFKVTRDIDTLLLSFAGIFTHKFGILNFIVVQIYFISGLVLLWLSVRQKLTSKN